MSHQTYTQKDRQQAYLNFLNKSEWFFGMLYQIFQVRNGAVRTMSIPEHQDTDKDYGKGSDRMCIMQALATSAVFLLDIPCTFVLFTHNRTDSISFH